MREKQTTIIRAEESARENERNWLDQRSRRRIDEKIRSEKIRQKRREWYEQCAKRQQEEENQAEIRRHQQALELNQQQHNHDQQRRDQERGRLFILSKFKKN